jgi:hypothetical protein
VLSTPYRRSGQRTEKFLFLLQNAAIFWYNLLHTGLADEATLHGGCPVLIGEKWGSCLFFSFFLISLKFLSDSANDYNRVNADSKNQPVDSWRRLNVQIDRTHVHLASMHALLDKVITVYLRLFVVVRRGRGAVPTDYSSERPLTVGLSELVWKFYLCFSYHVSTWVFPTSGMVNIGDKFVKWIKTVATSVIDNFSLFFRDHLTE